MNTSPLTVEKYGVALTSKLIGESVINRDNEDLGKIHELVIDAQSGRLAYAVLSFGGFLGMGSKLFALPCSEGLSGCVLHGIAGQCACSEHATIALVRVGFSNLNLLFHGIS